uniref:WW domain-containing protein n=1 Tax=Chromera velia CCMP2878 TaxID=1169474 RepID=A0A0G4HBK9_9ALVE|eukprot:Cvel_25973.t1-p1 / transcript=Cvel_25973.t1 / gene=Cvel_25973 / organism=Chromera_velia_CCMP2878 / gene_product=WW domain-binding protein 4, putative / transcript_product=WW domain-binding protein 4, putative / location=Cvel_scaffold3015:4606-6081(-) / protein_length=492 / sequence_SO=supercontig / SO=protein_coding / is_pseudo=false
MTTKWVSNERHFCELCQCWLGGNKISIAHHEQSKRHQENLTKQHLEQRKKARDKKIAEETLTSELAQINAAAAAAAAKDAALFGAASSSAALPPSTSTDIIPASTEIRGMISAPPVLEPAPKRLKESPSEEAGGSASDWEVNVDPSSGCLYYSNKRTGVSVWERPAELQGLDLVNPPAPPPPPGSDGAAGGPSGGPPQSDMPRGGLGRDGGFGSRGGGGGGRGGGRGGSVLPLGGVKDFKISFGGKKKAWEIEREKEAEKAKKAAEGVESEEEEEDEREVFNQEREAMKYEGKERKFDASELFREAAEEEERKNISFDQQKERWEKMKARAAETGKLSAPDLGQWEEVSAEESKLDKGVPTAGRTVHSSLAAVEGDEETKEGAGKSMSVVLKSVRDRRAATDFVVAPAVFNAAADPAREMLDAARTAPMMAAEDLQTVKRQAGGGGAQAASSSAGGGVSAAPGGGFMKRGGQFSSKGAKPKGGRRTAGDDDD